MKKSVLVEQIHHKKSFLCVGLDTAMDRIPKHLLESEDPIFEFNKAIVEATRPYAVAYKPNWAFYEALGSTGMTSLRKTLEIIPKDMMVVADAKRGDIGNTARMYAKAFFDELDVDSITLAPYMGKDAVDPFLERADKWAFVLALTSNPGAADLQYHDNGEEKIYQRVLRLGQTWAAEQPGELGFVVGATRAEAMAEIRSLAPHSFFLVPGIGAQGGDLHAVIQHGRNAEGGLLINSSRGIIYAGSGEDFAAQAAAAAAKLQGEMKAYF